MLLYVHTDYLMGCLHRAAYILLNLLNKLGKRDKMRGLPSILSLFRNKFNKFNSTGAQMLDSIYHRTLKLLKNNIFDLKTSRLGHHLLNVIMDVSTQHFTSGLSILLHAVISLPHPMS